MKEQEETYGSDEAPTPLRTFADVRRALAKTLRRLERGSVETNVAAVLVNGYGSLAKMLREDLADDITKRVEAIEARQAAH